MASTLIEDARVSAIETALRRLDAAATDPTESIRRTRVITLLAWVPPDWESAALATLAGLADRHPSRTILLLPDPGSPRDAIDAEVEVRVFGDGTRAIASEVVTIHLRGSRTKAPGSIAMPLLVADLPAVLRWRGSLPYGAGELDQLVDICDRLVVDSSEWDDLPAQYGSLGALFEAIAVSDIAWARTRQWRAAIAELWPDVARVESLSIRSPLAEAALLRGWLSDRLGREIALEHQPGPDVEGLELDGRPVTPRRRERLSPSELLSDQLELQGRDRIYEAAVLAAAALGASR